MTVSSSLTPRDSQGTGILIFIWVLSGIATLVVMLRIIAKVKIRLFRLDDLVMIAALVICLIASSFSTSAVRFGYGQRSPVPSEDNAIKARQFYLIGQAIMLAGTALGRVAFVLYMLAILGGKIWHRIVLVGLTVLGLVINLVCIIMIFTMCPNVNGNWDCRLGGRNRLIQVELSYSYFQSGFNTFIDLYLAIVPTWIFWHLNLKLNIKLSLVVLMSLGLIAMAAALAKTVQLQQMTQDMLTGTTDLLRWAFLEGYLVITTASLPCLRSLIMSSILYTRGNGDRSRSYELRTPYDGAVGSTNAIANTNSHWGTDSRLRNILPRSNSMRTGGSVDYILGSRDSVDGMQMNGIGQDLKHQRKCIRKQVDVSVVEEDK
ncbi:hypothetical protein BGW36DRAFT_427869 [Talaromyces proteolyticus]|uniref:Rhodopsin domain-containing protein n=1 Tax=Talaromyces proteolyticus TaxID=1131652 RepID=A0AAD4KST0_9EURO|nr:uncharacterized protein BGW36DRAFT_427869 [Talaromyces proteolyticus]KAH8697933.1 hypothetical protein BGW36DRAFT_427869 [Talaromyces proteolyticus]